MSRLRMNSLSEKRQVLYASMWIWSSLFSARQAKARSVVLAFLVVIHYVLEATPLHERHPTAPGCPRTPAGRPCGKWPPRPPACRTPTASRGPNCYCCFFVPLSYGFVGAKVVNFTKKTFLFIISRAIFEKNCVHQRNSNHTWKM